jgi:hypothetical protein
MPQIWMTYEELGDLLQCGSDGARARIREDRLDRKISHDGHKRVKLNLMLTGIFLDRIRSHAYAQLEPAIDSAPREFAPLDLAIEDLRRVHSQMADYDASEDGLFDVERPASRTGAAA